MGPERPLLGLVQAGGHERLRELLLELRDEALRPVAEESLHVTLCFLGHIPEEDVERAAAIVTGLRPRPVAMTLRAEPVAKPKGRPGLFAIDVASPVAVELQGELSAALVAAELALSAHGVRARREARA